MKRKIILSVTVVFMFLLVSFWGMTEEVGNNPVAVSPGSETEAVTVWQSCPTFSWTSVDRAASYRIAVFEAIDPIVTPYEDMVTKASPVINKDIPGPALSWTLSAEESLKSGSMYVWYVQALDASGNDPGMWSGGRIFKVEQEVRFAGVEEKLAEKLRNYGVNEETITNVLKDIKSEVKEVVVRNGGAGNKNNPGAGVIQGYEGEDNTFYGLGAGSQNTTGWGNTFIGRAAGRGNGTGGENTFIGSSAGYYNTTGFRNVFVGFFSGYANTTGKSNTFLGMYSGHLNTTGIENTLIGNYAGYSNTSGYSNTFLGTEAGIGNTEGYKNTFIGRGAGYSNTTGLGNVFLGFNAGYNEAGSNKLYIANSNTSSPLIYGEFDNGIVTVNGKLGIGTKTPGYTMEVDTTGSNSCIVVKRTDGATNYINATDTYANFGSTTNHPLRLVVNSAWKMRLNQDGSLSMSNGASLTTGGVWTNASSRELKENIVGLSSDEALDALNKLSPVKYNYKIDKTDKHVGFIAEDVPELVATADRKGMSPMDVTAVLTKVVQEQQKVNREQEKIISNLQERIAKIENK